MWVLLPYMLMTADDVVFVAAAVAVAASDVPVVVEPWLLVSVVDGNAVDSIVAVVLSVVDIHIYHVAAFDIAIVVYN